MNWLFGNFHAAKRAGCCILAEEIVPWEEEVWSSDPILEFARSVDFSQS